MNVILNIFEYEFINFRVIFGTFQGVISLQNINAPIRWCVLGRNKTAQR